MPIFGNIRTCIFRGWYGHLVSSQSLVNLVREVKTGALHCSQCSWWWGKSFEHGKSWGHASSATPFSTSQPLSLSMWYAEKATPIGQPLTERARGSMHGSCIRWPMWLCWTHACYARGKKKSTVWLEVHTCFCAFDHCKSGWTVSYAYDIIHSASVIL